VWHGGGKTKPGFYPLLEGTTQGCPRPSQRSEQIYGHGGPGLHCVRKGHIKGLSRRLKKATKAALRWEKTGYISRPIDRRKEAGPDGSNLGRKKLEPGGKAETWPPGRTIGESVRGPHYLGSQPRKGGCQRGMKSGIKRRTGGVIGESEKKSVSRP